MISGADGPASIAPCLRGNGNPIAEEQDKVAYDLQEKVVLITGAAGGIGAATAGELHACATSDVISPEGEAALFLD
ncbi:hypothetical protein [Burkholderia cenocepacia]|uniref:hypothetical protein n=1 Tax=Burkholderia cenocepacia TaxID=95486 RepID=UPI00286F4B4D|nr:hypothetical protein [Burkholderia cenocepacia]